VTGLVVEATPDHAKLRLAGPVQGRVDGAAVEIDLRGVALFDRREVRLTRINLGWKESRKVGPATPALDATAKLNLTITPGDETERIGADELLLAAASQPDWRLEVPVADGRWRLLADRDWFVVASDRRATTVRRVVDGRVVAMTTLVAAARREPSLADYAQRVRYHLGERLGRITHTGESRSDEGVRRLAIASVGQESGQPVEWRHHHLAGPDGSLAATTTLPADDAAANDAVVVRLVESATPVERLETASAADALAR